jgi:hypothetical protein
MTTFIGTQRNFTEALQALIPFEHAVIELYDAAIKSLRKHFYKEKLRDFKENHKRHIDLVMELLEEHGEMIPEGPVEATYCLKAPKSMVEDKDILKVLKRNEEVVAKVYERMNTHTDKWEDADPIIAWSMEDEHIQQEWLKHTLKEA